MTVSVSWMSFWLDHKAVRFLFEKIHIMRFLYEKIHIMRFLYEKINVMRFQYEKIDIMRFLFVHFERNFIFTTMLTLT